MRFKFLTGDVNWQDYGGKFISRKLNNGDFDYWIVMEVLNWYDAVGEREAKEGGSKYNVSLSAVSPQEAGKDQLEQAFNSYDSEVLNDPLAQVEALGSYGIKAPLWNMNGNNLGKLMREARKQADLASGLFGFYMDAPKNAIGSTGWDCIKGDITAGLYRQRD